MSGPYHLVWDDFSGGLRVTGPDARWAYYTFGALVGDDGESTGTGKGLRVRSRGRHPVTGEPAFLRTTGRENGDPAALPGVLDHVKWLVYGTSTASTGLPGFDAEPGRELLIEAVLGGRTYGTERHPFGGRVAAAGDDLRLAAVCMPLLDVETFMLFDFFLSNERIYAGYERLPFARGQHGNYAAFLYTVPVGPRTPEQEHRLGVGYDRAAGVARWYVDGTEVMRVDRIGRHLPSREHLILDHGGEEATVAPRQLNCGLGMFTILDATRPGEESGLVQLTEHDEHYARPVFWDSESDPASRLFGQGAELTCTGYTITSRPAQKD